MPRPPTDPTSAQAPVNGASTWRPRVSSRVFRPAILARLEEVRSSVSPAAFELYVLSLLVADEEGSFSKAEVKYMEAALDAGLEVGYDRLADGAVRVWYREAAP